MAREREQDTSDGTPVEKENISQRVDDFLDKRVEWRKAHAARQYELSYRNYLITVKRAIERIVLHGIYDILPKSAEEWEAVTEDFDGASRKLTKQYQSLDLEATSYFSQFAHKIGRNKSNEPSKADQL